MTMSPVTAVASSDSASLVVSGTDSGEVLLFQTRPSPTFLCQICAPTPPTSAPSAVRAIKILQGRFLVLRGHDLRVVSTHDRVLASVIVDESFCPEMIPSRMGRFVVTASSSGISIRSLRTLKILRQIDTRLSAPVVRLVSSDDCRCVLAVLADDMARAYSMHRGIGGGLIDDAEDEEDDGDDDQGGGD